MNMNTSLLLSPEVVASLPDDVVLERIPDEVYQGMVDQFSRAYHFENGERMRISNYVVKISRSLSDAFVQFIHETIEGLDKNQFPGMASPEGFLPHPENLTEVELKGGFSLGSFDMAVTEEGLQNIEFQSVATYPLSAAKLNQYVLDHMAFDNAFIFADSPETNWEAFTDLYSNVIGGNMQEGIVLVDRKIKDQKTNFEFFATQQELDIPVEIVDLEAVFEKEGGLFYANSPDQEPVHISRFYNRILLAESLFEDGYPHNTKMWNFRFDEHYQSLKFINHPIKQFEVSKRLSPYIDHPYNPDCYELSEVAQDFLTGKLKYEDYVWKHKWGAAGHRLILEPDAISLADLSEHWGDYIAQKKVAFKVFKTDDHQDKIVELRFMTAIHEGEMIVVPMARIGHTFKNQQGHTQFSIHFGENNKAGYGFSPVVIVDGELGGSDA